MIISVNAEKASVKTQYPFMIQTLMIDRKLGRDGNFLSFIKDIYVKPQLASYSLVKD